MSTIPGAGRGVGAVNSPSVALVDPLGHHGGQHYYTDQLARGLREAGVQVVVYGLAGESLCQRQSVYPYVPAFNLIYGDSPALMRGLRFAHGLLQLGKGIVRERHSLVHVNVWQYSIRELLQVLVAFFLRRRIILTIHDVETFGARTSGLRRQWIMSLASGLVVHNDYSLQQIPGHLARGKEISTIPHVCHVDYLRDLPSRREARAELGLPGDRTIMLFFGNPRHEKGLDIALEALARLKGRKDLLLLTGGRMPPTDQEHFRKFIEKHRLSDQVRLDTDTVPDQLAFSYYAASDIVLVPYRKVYESGVSIMAASCARPIIASDLPVLIDFVDDGRAGFLFKSESPDDMARAIELATGPDVSLDSLGAQAREGIERERNYKRVGAMTAELYARVGSTS